MNDANQNSEKVDETVVGAENVETTNPESSSSESSADTSTAVEENLTETVLDAQEVETLKSALNQAQDKNLRLHAEFDNYRRRTAKEQLEIIETANGKLLGKLSEVLDNFDRAFASENKGSAENFEKGISLIYEQFRKVLSDSGLEVIDPVGQEFDPNSSEAFMKQPSDTVPENHVVTVFQKGYKLKNKILKTAKVIVSAGK